LGPLTLTVAMLIACVKSFIVLSNFMHLKYESLLLRILVAMVFVLFALIVAITFIDYAFR
jgi:cytochrome c oxidase subunit 4